MMIKQCYSKTTLNDNERAKLIREENTIEEKKSFMINNLKKLIEWIIE